MLPYWEITHHANEGICAEWLRLVVAFANVKNRTRCVVPMDKFNMHMHNVVFPEDLVPLVVLFVSSCLIILCAVSCCVTGTTFRHQ